MRMQVALVSRNRAIAKTPAFFGIWYLAEKPSILDR